MAAAGDGRVRDALRAAHLYFLQDLTMDAIAVEMGTSRSTVSRLLSFARQTGLVEIRVHSPADEADLLQREIRRRYDVAAHIVPIPGHISDVDLTERVSLAAARILTRFIDSGMIIGIAWGSTLTAVSRHLVPKRLHDVEFVQLNGSGNAQTTGLDYTSDILRRFAEAYAAISTQFPVPAFFDSPATKAAVWRERSTRAVLDVQRRMDMAVFSLGSPLATVPSRVYTGGYLDGADFRELEREHVVGDVATVFYREDGSYRDIAINARATGPDLARLTRVPRRIAIVAGTSKLAGLRGALRAGLITDLILDEPTARALTRS